MKITVETVVTADIDSVWAAGNGMRRGWQSILDSFARHVEASG
jgi:hypothetical protein